ncbi:MAG: xylulokinase [Acidimicrobiia bacterium]|nr:xylulokinase [Acidimicrobiia bacterium]
MAYVLGIDTSTTATKALLVDESGAVVGEASAEYPFETPQPLWAEQEAGLWWTATIDAIGAVLAKTGVAGAEVEAVGLTGQMHGLVLLDEADRPLRPAILWNDQRTGAECDEMRTTLGRDRLIATTGNDALAGFTAPKMLWVRNHEPDFFSQIRHVLLPKDYLRLCLTGEHAVDRAGGSGTILFDLAERDWSQSVLADLDLDAGWFPQTFEGPAVTGTVTEEAAAATGLVAGTPVVGGGGDQAANAVGVGAIREGVAALSLGTSGVVFVTTDTPQVEPEGRLHAFCHAVPDKWHLMGVMLSAAGSLRWFNDELAPGVAVEDLVASAESVPAGSDGLIFLPYLSGERTPHPDPLARGAFVGLTVRHTRAHLVRAVLEGVAFGLRDSLDLIRGTGVAVEQVRASGGGTRSELWRQILADILQAEVVTLGTAEGAAYGAAVLAAVGAGWHSSVEGATDAWVTLVNHNEPSPDADYTDANQRFRDLYPALAPTFHGMAAGPD